MLVGAVLSNQTVLFLPRDWAVRFKLLDPLLVPTLMVEVSAKLPTLKGNNHQTQKRLNKIPSKGTNSADTAHPKGSIDQKIDKKSQRKAPSQQPSSLSEELVRSDSSFLTEDQYDRIKHTDRIKRPKTLSQHKE